MSNWRWSISSESNISRVNSMSNSSSCMSSSESNSTRSNSMSNFAGSSKQNKNNHKKKKHNELLSCNSVNNKFVMGYYSQMRLNTIKQQEDGTLVVLQQIARVKKNAAKKDH